MNFSAAALWAENLHEHRKLLDALGSIGCRVSDATELLVRAISQGGKIMFCGNGGSAADAQHLAAEFTGRFMLDRPPLAAIALCTDTSALTSISNDYSFAHVFERQLRALARRGDVLIAISTSGNSPNLLNAVATARALGVDVIGLLGRDGGKLQALCDLPIVVPSDSTPRIQEIHILIGHTLCGAVERTLELSPNTAFAPVVASE